MGRLDNLSPSPLKQLNCRDKKRDQTPIKEKKCFQFVVKHLYKLKRWWKMSGNFTVEVKVKAKAKFTLIIETRVALALAWLSTNQVHAKLHSQKKKKKEKSKLSS